MQEFGGCLPTERFLAKTPINQFDRSAVKLNSGRAAIYLAASSSPVVYLPYYTCPSIKPFLEDRGLCVKEYALDQKFSPVIPQLQAGEMLVWTDYYGCMKPEIIKNLTEHYGNQLIIDHCQGLFSKPVHGAFNVYSLRKFIGVPCGAVLYYSAEFEETEELIETHARSAFLEKAQSEGSNAAYSLYQENEKAFRTEYGAMPKSVEQIIMRVDFRDIQCRRQENFLAVHKVLSPLNHLKNLDFSGKTPLMYPYLSNRPGLREYLLKQQIFCPTWWRRVLSLEGPSAFEKDLARRLIPIPIDQRYSKDDVIEVANLILRWENQSWVLS